MSALLTDYYQLTMLKSYFELGMNEPAVFEFFFRRLPESRNFLLAAGLEPVLDYLEQLAFSADELGWLARQPGFPPRFVDWLGSFRFTGDVDAMPEGTVCFADEPILRVVAPLPQAQLIETRLISLMHFSTLIASKAARAVLAAPDKLLVDFGLRRAHGAEAGILAARSAFLAGFAGTATVPAGYRYGIPLYGTMAHSFIQAHDEESEAFLNFARGHPGNTTLLIDTYDTERAAQRLVALMPRLRAEGLCVGAVRIDSGDLAAHARRVRSILDDGGARDVKIFASGGLDEHSLAQLVAAPIDGFGVGTSLTTSSDAAALDCAYKLQEYAGRARRKRSEGKSTWPGRKQVYRNYDATNASMQGDILCLESERCGEAPLLEPAMRSGKRVAPACDLASLRQRAGNQLRSLPEPFRRLAKSDRPYPVEVSSGLRSLTEMLDRSAH